MRQKNKQQNKLLILLPLLVTLVGFMNPPEAFAGIGGFFNQIKDIADDVRETTNDGVIIFEDVDKMGDILEGDDEKPKTKTEETQQETDCDIDVSCPSNSQ